MSSTSLEGATPASRAAQTVEHEDAEKHWLNTERLRLYSITVLICYAAWLAIYFYKAVWHPHEYVSPLAIDFLPFWSSSSLALHGHAVDAYNLTVLEKIESGAIAHSVGILPWLYPPTFLLIVYPFALLPWKIAAVTFLVGTYLLFVKAIHSIVPRRGAICVSLAFPGAALALASGQNGLFTASLAAFGLAVLPRRPIVAGIAFGILCVKPQLAVLFPLALLCSRSWRALASLSVTALTMLALSLAAFGTETLAAFLHNMGMAAGFVEDGRASLARVPSAFSLVKLAHGPTAVAFAAQEVSAIFAVVAVWLAWHREAPYPLRAATLACASLMVSPYLFDYDLAWYGLIVAWYVKHAMTNGWRRGEREWLGLLWLMPLAGILVVMRIHFQFLPLISAATLALLLKRIALERRSLN
ncbi:ABC transporter ATP-binding protein [Trinickia symbiotica]|uniref:ABC transporter ATP-binding protein n=1 Tax=Trinickia symbiotica TaxID=863227 RepID=A0A2T3XUQ3_9BURK|nr:glycosyltransferase family 87 protein [Trinickia symbiotica]PTB20231.1 ABC transporter ATP-binding protein [Trinickia symbiotica]